MRSVVHADLVAAARVLLARPEIDRLRTMTQLIDEAHAADAYRKRFGRAHMLWGDGSLQSAAAQRMKAPERLLGDADYCQCMLMAFEALLERKTRLDGANRSRS